VLERVPRNRFDVLDDDDASRLHSFDLRLHSATASVAQIRLNLIAKDIHNNHVHTAYSQ
jgi:hypothetical protein